MEKEILMAGIEALSQAISAEPTATLYKERGRLRMLAGDSQGAMEGGRIGSVHAGAVQWQVRQ